MDYTKLPRSLIYKDRTNLNDFGVQVVGMMNNYLFTQMRKLTLLQCGNAKEIALQCFNNAYYICTLVQLDEFPDLSMDKYEEKLSKVPIPFPDDVYQASMALVCVLLAAYDDKYKQKDDLLINSIHHWTSSNKWNGSYSRKSFNDIINTCNTNSYILPKSEFAPRDIIEVIETFDERYLQVYAEYICERLALLEDPRQRMHGADMAIARIKDYQRELCEDNGYNPKEDCFKYDDNDSYSGDFIWENNIRNKYHQSKDAIDYYTTHYPKEDNLHHEQQTDSTVPFSDNAALVAEKEQLRQQLTQRDSEVHELGEENAKLNMELAKLSKRVEEAHTIPDTVHAHQRVRMELARKLMEAAGINEDVLGKWGNKDKAGTIMGTMLDITPTTCKTYLSDPCLNKVYHQKTIEKINSLLKDLGVDIQL